MNYELLKEKIINKIKRTDIINLDTLIGKKAEIVGDINAKGNVKIDGKFTGNVNINGDLIIGENCVLVGNITAKNVIIAGNVDGNIIASGRLSIKDTAKVKGEHTSGSLIVDEGSKFVGNCVIKEN